MYKLLLGLGIIDLAFNFPHLTSLCLVGVFLYNNLTDEDKQQIMTIYSNGKEFSKYLTKKAQELGITLPELRKQMVVDLEIPESTEIASDSAQNFDTEDTLSNKLKEYIGDNLVNELKTNQALFEYVASQLASFIPEYLEHSNNPTKEWIEDISLTDFFYNLGIFAEPPEILHNYYLDYRDLLNKLNVDFNAPYSYKIHRGIKSKLKAQGKNELNEVVDHDLVEFSNSLIDKLELFFRGEYFNPLETKAIRLSEANSFNFDVNLVTRIEDSKCLEE
jgi:hypothetical protein